MTSTGRAVGISLIQLAKILQWSQRIWDPNIILTVPADVLAPITSARPSAGTVLITRLDIFALTHWGRVTYICFGKLTIIGSDNGLVPGWNQWWNLVNWTLRNKFQWNLKQNSYIFIQETAFETVICEMAFILSRPQCVKVSAAMDDFCQYIGPDENIANGCRDVTKSCNSSSIDKMQTSTKYFKDGME